MSGDVFLVECHCDCPNCLYIQCCCGPKCAVVSVDPHDK